MKSCPACLTSVPAAAIASCSPPHQKSVPGEYREPAGDQEEDAPAYPVVRLLNVARQQGRREFAGHDSSIVGTEAERNQRADVAEHRMPNFGLQLVEVLMREHQADVVLAQL